MSDLHAISHYRNPVLFFHGRDIMHLHLGLHRPYSKQPGFLVMEAGQQVDEPAVCEHDVGFEDANVEGLHAVAFLEDERVVEDALFGEVAVLLQLLEALVILRARQVVGVEAVRSAETPLLVPGRVVGRIDVRDQDVEA
ncbi:hypothetical protein E4U55_004015 [Claviceps digitariae]|nr:hypothetical protein E4U55_004015 [Claviceps digitariae]